MFSKILKLATFLSVFTAILLFSKITPVSASAAENLRGWAYTSKGYISFNCLDDGYAGHFPFTFTFPFNIAPCAYNQHGVNLDANNNFSGSAWNSVEGFIDFTATSTPSNAFRVHCGPGNIATSTACYDEVSREVFGYMYVRTKNEWITLDGLPNPTQITNYTDPQPGIFSGYATSTTFGSISFNCANDNSCVTNNYFVKIGPLEIRQMSAPNWDASLACKNNANRATLQWTLRSGKQSAYEIIVSTQNSTSTGVILDSTASSTVPQAPISSLAYDTPYYWFLKLWDDTGSSTPWRQFNTSGTKDWISDNFARNSVIGNTKTFTSYKHEFPLPSFTWTPTEILIATTSNSFVSNSYYYDNSNTSHPCTGLLCSFNWKTSDGAANILSSSTASTSISFTKATNTIVTLVATDSDSYSCSTSTVLNVNYALPLWKEVKATSTP